MNRWKIWGVIGVLSLGTCLPARADDKLPIGEIPREILAPKVEVTGKLRYVVRHWRTKELIGIYDKLPTPISRSWSIGFGVTVGGQTIDIETPRDMKYEDVEKLVGLTVKVTGRDVGDHITAQSLVAVQAVKVRVRGFLDVTVLERFPALTVVRIRAEGKYYSVRFATPDLEKLAEQLGGRRVFIDGTLDGQTITAETLRADDTGYVMGRVEMSGTLRVLALPYRLLEPAILERHPHVFQEWQIEAGGRTYSVTFANPALEARAEKLAGKPVIIKGKLDGESVTVEELTEDEATSLVVVGLEKATK